jgi:hypothetical protein
MVKDVKRLSFFPFILFLIFSIVFFIIFYSFLQNYLSKETIETQHKILSIEKKYLKNDVQNFKNSVNLVFEIAYNETNSNLEIFLKTLANKNLVNNFYVSEDNYVVFGKISKKG